MGYQYTKSQLDTMQAMREMVTWNIIKCLWPVHKGPRIDMWDDREPNVHEFGYWADGRDAGVDCPPKTSIKLEIQGDGNYPGSPSTRDFYTWIGKCVKKPTLFTLQNYYKEFCFIEE